MGDAKDNTSDQHGSSVDPSNAGEVQKIGGNYPIVKLLKDFAPTLGLLLGAFYAGHFRFNFAWLLLFTVAYLIRKRLYKMREAKTKINVCLKQKEKLFSARVSDLPGWIYYPDVEKADWINKMFVKLWPFIGDYVDTLLKTSVQDAVRKSLPNCLQSFQFEVVNLGKVAPRVGGVKVYTENVRRDECILDAELFYSGDSSVVVSVAGAKAGIDDLWILGTIRIVFSPLIHKIPLIGAMEIYFLNTPTINFNLTNIANTLDFPGLSDSLRHVVHDIVESVIVLPNKISFSLSDNLETTRVKYSLPVGVLRIAIVEARDLVAADIAIIGKGSSDPYVRMSVGDEVKRTSTVKKTLNPEWNQWYEIVCEERPFESEIKFEVFDEDANSDDALGNGKLSLEKVSLAGGQYDGWLKLQNTKSGSLHVQVQWLELSNDPEELEKTEEVCAELEATNKVEKYMEDGEDCENSKLSSALLIVKLDSARNLPKGGNGPSEPSPFAKISVGNMSMLSAADESTTNPRWEQRYVFLLRGAINQFVSIEINDKKNKKQKRPLGELRYALRDVLTYPNMDTMQNMKLRNSGNDSEIFLGITLRSLIGRFTERAPKADVLSMAGMPLAAVAMGSGSLGEEEDHDENEVKDNMGSKAKDTTGVEKSLSKPDVSKAPSVSDSSSAARTSPKQTTAGAEGASSSRYGEIRLSSVYNTQKRRLELFVHEARNLQSGSVDSKKLPDPFVKATLMKESSPYKKDKTKVIDDDTSPVWDDRLEFSVSETDFKSCSLFLEVLHHHSAFKGDSNIASLYLRNPEIPQSKWFPLEDPEFDAKSRTSSSTASQEDANDFELIQVPDNNDIPKSIPSVTPTTDLKTPKVTEVSQPRPSAPISSDVFVSAPMNPKPPVVTPSVEHGAPDDAFVGKSSPRVPQRSSPKPELDAFVAAPALSKPSDDFVSAPVVAKPTPDSFGSPTTSPQSESSRVRDVAAPISSVADSSHSASPTPSSVKAPIVKEVPTDHGFGQIRLSLIYSTVKHRLELTVHEAKNVISTSTDTKKLPDPFVKATLLKDSSSYKKDKTKVIEDNYNPVWDERLDLSVAQTDLQQCTLFLEMFHYHSAFRGSTPMGTLLLKSVNPFSDVWFPLDAPAK